MRMIVDFEMPMEPFNSLVRDGTAGKIIQRIMEDLKPEAAYFSERHGKRGGILILDVASPSDVPRIAEVQFRVCMTPEDLASAGLDELGRKWG